MAGVKKLTSYFKLLTKDEMEVEELLATQISRNSKTVSIETAKTLSTLSSAVMSAIDLTALSSDFQPALTAIAVDYESDDDPEYIVSNDLDEGDCEVEFIGIVDNRNIGCVGDTVINALDTVIAQTSAVFSNDQPYYSHCKNSKRVRRNYNQRPENWCLIADYYHVYGNVANTIKHFSLNKDDGNKDHHYWRTMFGRWQKDMVKGKLLHQCGARVPPYGTKIDLQLVDTVKSYNDHAVPMTNMILRIQLIALLIVENRLDILDAIADTDESLTGLKKYRFSDQWALRFFKRHNLRSRVATTKMREEVPAKYEGLV